MNKKELGLVLARRMNITPVSYTHLDVYKRQHKNRRKQLSGTPVCRLIPTISRTMPLGSV